MADLIAGGLLWCCYLGGGFACVVIDCFGLGMMWLMRGDCWWFAGVGGCWLTCLFVL